MQLDRSTQKNLELLESFQRDKNAHTFLNVIDCTETPMGGRLLKTWLTHPLLIRKKLKIDKMGLQAFIRAPAVH